MSRIPIVVPAALFLAAQGGAAQQFELGQFLAGQVTNPETVCLADLDGDGDLDAAVPSSFDRNLSWFENLDGNGSFGPQRFVGDQAGGSNDVDAADLDGDGDLDLVVPFRATDEVAWFENLDGLGTFGEARTITGVFEPRDVVAADLDGDLDVDVLISALDGDSLRWHENDGAGNFGPPQILSSAPGELSAIATADLDGDGDRDVLSANLLSDTVVWYANDGAGNFGAATVIVASLGSNPRALFAADLTGEGDLDLVVATETDDSLAWYENLDGLGSFGPRHLVSDQLQHTSSAHAADLDGDGDQDLLGADGWTLFDPLQPAEVFWFENVDGAGTFEPRLIHQESNRPSALLTADVDGDGDADVFSVSAIHHQVSWFRNDGAGAFAAQPDLVAGVLGVRSVTGADLDGDGDVDALSASSGDGSIGWYENLDGLGRFGTFRTLTDTASGANSVVAADLDGDGDLDALASAAGADAVLWFENLDALGTFGPAQFVTTGAGNVQNVSAADLDGDGDLDALASAFDDDNVAWYENLDGLGHFGPARLVTSAVDAPWAVAAADLDGDGDLDVLSTQVFAPDNVAWYENLDGLGHFGPQRIITTALPTPHSVHAADLDGDGDRDVLATSQSGGPLAWFENLDGFGTFGPLRGISGGSTGLQDAIAADLDVDGDLDVVSAGSFTTRVNWHENLDGLGTFGPAKTVVAPAGAPYSVFAADVDGDGDPDVLSAWESGDQVAWHENRVCCALTADTPSLSLVAGGAQGLELDAGTQKGFHLYWLLTTTTGTSPGLTAGPAPLKLRLNFSLLLLNTILAPSGLVNPSLGFLGGAGRATTSLALPPGLDPGLAGVVLHHAYLVLDPSTLATVGTSEAVALHLAP